MKKLGKDFYMREVLTVAEDLIGCFLVREIDGHRIIGRINETEAYHGDIDKASHAYPHKLTKRTQAFFETGGVAYVYLIYGMYHCVNVVADKANVPCGALIRGVELIAGHEWASQYRYQKKYEELTKTQLKNFTNGPGKVGQALVISKELYGEDLQGDKLYICESIANFKKEVGKVERSKRIGIKNAEEAKDFWWRFTG